MCVCVEGFGGFCHFPPFFLLKKGNLKKKRVGECEFYEIKFEDVNENR